MEEVACFFTTSNNKSNESASKSEMARVGDTLENQEEHHQTETGEASKDDDPQPREQVPGSGAGWRVMTT